MNNINRQMASGAAWMLSLKLVSRVISIVSTIILARILVPEDFGLVAMATSIIALLELATAFSFEIPLIQNQNATKEHYATAWTLNALLHTALSIVLVAVAIPASVFFNEPRLVHVILFLSFGFLVSGVANIWFVEYRKNLNFRPDFLLMAAKKITGFVVTIPIAIIYQSYWALVIGAVSAKVVGTLLSYLMHSGRPTFSLSQSKEMIGFSKWLLANNSLAFLRNRSPDFIIGRISGAGSLGLFTIAYEIATLPTTELVAPLNRAVFPGYAKLARDIEKFKESYVGTLGIIALVALPAGLGLSAVSGPLVSVVLGETWAAAAPLISIIAIASAVSCLLANNSSVYYALGKPYIITLLGCAQVTLLLSTSITLGLREGVTGVATAYLLVALSFFPVSYLVLCRQLGLKFSSVIVATWRPVICACAMFFSVRALIPFMRENSYSNLAILPVSVSLGVIVYILGIFVLWTLCGRKEGPESWAVDAIRHVVMKVFGRFQKN